jgi:hypothetical protein
MEHTDKSSKQGFTIQWSGSLQDLDEKELHLGGCTITDRAESVYAGNMLLNHVSILQLPKNSVLLIVDYSSPPYINGVHHTLR